METLKVGDEDENSSIWGEELEEYITDDEEEEKENQYEKKKILGWEEKWSVNINQFFQSYPPYTFNIKNVWREDCSDNGVHKIIKEYSNL